MKKIIYLGMLLLYTVTMIFCFIVYGKQHNTNIELKNKINYMEYRMQQTEERCKRMTDSCIDILSNERWN